MNVLCVLDPISQNCQKNHQFPKKKKRWYRAWFVGGPGGPAAWVFNKIVALKNQGVGRKNYGITPLLINTLISLMMCLKQWIILKKMEFIQRFRKKFPNMIGIETKNVLTEIEMGLQQATKANRRNRNVTEWVLIFGWELCSCI